MTLPRVAVSVLVSGGSGVSLIKSKLMGSRMPLAPANTPIARPRERHPPRPRTASSCPWPPACHVPSSRSNSHFSGNSGAMRPLRDSGLTWLEMCSVNRCSSGAESRRDHSVAGGCRGRGCPRRSGQRRGCHGRPDQGRDRCVTSGAAHRSRSGPCGGVHMGTLRFPNGWRVSRGASAGIMTKMTRGWNAAIASLTAESPNGHSRNG